MVSKIPMQRERVNKKSNAKVIGVMINVLLILVLSYTLASAVTPDGKVELDKPWHILSQIAKSDTDLTSIDSDKNGRIDAGIIEDTLQDITNNGATTTLTINVGGINSAGAIISSGNLNIGAGKLFVDVSTGRVGIGTSNPQATLDVNGNIRISSLINCNGKLYTDGNGVIKCGTDQVNDADADPTNELQTLAEVLQRGNDAQGMNIENINTLSAQKLCLNGNCITSWDEAGIGRILDIDKDGVPYIEDCDDSNRNIGRAADGTCDGDGDGYIDKTAYVGSTDEFCDYDDNHPGGWSGYGCGSCPWGYWTAYFSNGPDSYCYDSPRRDNGWNNWGVKCRNCNSGGCYDMSWTLPAGGTKCK